MQLAGRKKKHASGSKQVRSSRLEIPSQSLVVSLAPATATADQRYDTVRIALAGAAHLPVTPASWRANSAGCVFALLRLSWRCLLSTYVATKIGCVSEYLAVAGTQL